MFLGIEAAFSALSEACAPTSPSTVRLERLLAVSRTLAAAATRDAGFPAVAKLHLGPSLLLHAIQVISTLSLAGDAHDGPVPGMADRGGGAASGPVDRGGDTGTPTGPCQRASGTGGAALVDSGAPASCRPPGGPNDSEDERDEALENLSAALAACSGDVSRWRDFSVGGGLTVKLRELDLTEGGVGWKVCCVGRGGGGGRGRVLGTGIYVEHLFRYLRIHLRGIMAVIIIG